MRRTLWIFAAGLSIRLLAIAYLARVKPILLVWGVNEAGNIARSLIQAHSFSSPFHDAHGPTAWLAPGYPAVVALAFWIFGVQTPASAIAMVVFNAICSACTGVVVYFLGKELAGEKAGLIAGWFWAISPYLAILPFILWDTSFSALLLGAALLQTLRLQSGVSENWAVCGATWGIAALVNPALVAPLPILVIALLAFSRKPKSVAVMILSTVLVLVPWTVRNYTAFHKILPIRSNGLTEIYFANYGFDTHPLGPSMQYQNEGEAAFTSETGAQAIQRIASQPLTFLRNSAQRAFWFWLYPVSFWELSLAVAVTATAGLFVLFRISKPRVFTLLAILGVYPLVYYASQVVSRYRHPIEPVLYALSGVALARISSRRSN